MMRRRRRIAVRLLAAGAAALLALAVLTARPADPALFPPRAGGPAVPAFVLDNGLHADLVLPREALAASDGPSARAVRMAPPGAWIQLGWGDERFYKETGLGPRRLADALRCLFWPFNTRTIVRLEALPAPPDRIYGPRSVLELRLSPQGMRRLSERLDRSFVEGQGAPVLTPSPPTDPSGLYFRSTGRFSVLHLCNHWIAGLLHAAGVPVTPVADTVTEGLKLDLRLRARARPAAGSGRG